MTKDEMLKIILRYYESINRNKIPDMTNYSKKDLMKVIELFNLY